MSLYRVYYVNGRGKKCLAGLSFNKREANQIYNAYYAEFKVWIVKNDLGVSETTRLKSIC